jgi:bacterioferritin (cytochrome b1)
MVCHRQSGLIPEMLTTQTRRLGATIKYDYCEQFSDYVSRQLLAEVLKSEEEYVVWLEPQRGLITQVGLENYQQANL